MLDERRYNEYANSPAEFRKDLVIDCGGKPATLGERLQHDAWQDADFKAMDGAWLQAVGRRTAPAGQPLRAWLERPRGHSKTSDQAVMNAWALAFAPRVVRGYAASGDKDQARLLRDAILVLCRLNPLLNRILSVDKYTVTNVARQHAANGSTLEILANSPQTSWGLLFDWCTVDEPTHWDDSGEEFWVSLLSAAAKRPNALLLAIANCGWRTHWTWRVREAVRDSARWFFSHLDGCCASWILPDELAEQRRLLPPSQAARLFDNCWQDQAGDALPDDQVKAAICRTAGIDREIPQLSHVQCLDLSWRRDSSALLVVGMDFIRQKLVLCAERRWQPRDFTSGEICFATVADQVRLFRNIYRAHEIVADSWGGQQMLQTLANEGMSAFCIVASSQTKTAEAKSLIDILGEGILECHESGLANDLRGARMIEKPGAAGGLRIELPRNDAGHSDSLAAFLVAAPSLLGSLRNGDPRNVHEPDYGRVVPVGRMSHAQYF